LQIPPGNRLELLRGNRHGHKGQVSENSASTTSSLLVHPGEVLLEEFLRPMGISQYRLALAIGVPESRINTIAVPFLRPQRRLLVEDAGQP